MQHEEPRTTIIGIATFVIVTATAFSVLALYLFFMYDVQQQLHLKRELTPNRILEQLRAAENEKLHASSYEGETQRATIPIEMAIDLESRGSWRVGTQRPVATPQPTPPPPAEGFQTGGPLGPSPAAAPQPAFADATTTAPAATVDQPAVDADASTTATIGIVVGEGENNVPDEQPQ